MRIKQGKLLMILVIIPKILHNTQILILKIIYNDDGTCRTIAPSRRSCTSRLADITVCDISDGTMALMLSGLKKQ